MSAAARRRRGCRTAVAPPSRLRRPDDALLASGHLLPRPLLTPSHPGPHPPPILAGAPPRAAGGCWRTGCARRRRWKTNLAGCTLPRWPSSRKAAWCARQRPSTCQRASPAGRRRAARQQARRRAPPLRAPPEAPAAGPPQRRRPRMLWATCMLTAQPRGVSSASPQRWACQRSALSHAPPWSGRARRPGSACRPAGPPSS